MKELFAKPKITLDNKKRSCYKINWASKAEPDFVKKELLARWPFTLIDFY